MTKPKSNKASSEKPAHLARFHKSPVLRALVEASNDLGLLVQEAEVAAQSVWQSRSEILPANSTRPEEEKEDRCLWYYGWVIRLQAVIDPLSQSINDMQDALDKAKNFLKKDSNRKSVRGYDLCKLLELNVVTACILLRRALKAFEATEYDIGDATFTIYLAQLLSQRAERKLAWLDGVPKLPIADENETDWQAVKSDRATSRLIAHALRFAEDMGDSGVGCISAGDHNSEGYRAARILREKGWNAQMQDSLSPGMTPGLQISGSRKKDA